MVAEVGADVTTVRPGDRVVLSAIPTCGRCYFCARASRTCAPELTTSAWPASATVRRDPRRRRLGTFADAVVVSELAAVPVRTDLPAEQLALLGCAVATGTGSAINLASIEPGDSVVVIGAGGIGLCARKGPAEGARQLIVLDPVTSSRQLATRCGRLTRSVRRPMTSRRRSPSDPWRRGRHRHRLRRFVSDPRSGVGDLRRGGTIVEIGVSAPTVGVNVPLVQIPLSGSA